MNPYLNINDSLLYEMDVDELKNIAVVFGEYKIAHLEKDTDPRLYNAIINKKKENVT